MHIFYFQEEKYFEKNGRTKILVKTLKSKKCSVDTAKIRTLRLFSNSGKKWWLFIFLIIVRSLRSFTNCLGTDKTDYMVSE